MRKSKGQTFSLFLLITITAVMLNIGLALLLGIGGFFDERAEELNTAHFATLQSEKYPIGSQLEFIRNTPEVTEIETVNVLMGLGGYYYDDSLSHGHIILAQNSIEQQMNPPALIGDSLPLIGNAIYIPHFIFSSGGYALGDDIRLEFLDSELWFTVAGSTEEIMFGASTFTVWRFYVSDEKYSELQSQFHDGKYTLISARMTENWAAFAAGYSSEFAGVTPVIANYDYFHNRVLIPTIPALLLVVFAIILLLVGSIVIRFRINNDIEESMKNIGALKAIGYRSQQIILSIIIQFGLIAFIGGTVGIIPAQITLPLVTDMLIEPMLGMPWNPAFNMTVILAALISILFVVLLFAFVTAKRISKLHPIIAMRGGMTTHSFKKNNLPLDKTRGSLNLLLAAKQLLHNKKQAVMLGIIIFGVTFSSVAVFTMHYNVNVNMDTFVNTVLGDVPDVNVWLHDSNDGTAIREWMEERPEVYSFFGREIEMLQIDDYIVSIVIVEDFAYHTGYSMIGGRYPLLDSEIVLDGITLQTMNKNIGDWVTVKIDGNEHEFIITGSVQLMGSFVGMMKGDGMKRLQPDFDFTGFGLYVTGEMADTADFIEIINAEKGDIIAKTYSLHGHIDNILSSIGGLFSALGFVVMFVVAAVVILVLYLIIKTIIVRRKRELGIQKAIGFTTLQLMNQITLNLTPIIVIGTIFGAIIGYIGFNPMFIALMRGMGVAQANLPVPANWIIMVTVGLILLSYTVSMLIAWRIRKISAYALVSE
ncbi:MAG: ABC transporter permease [Lachnospiraceae bacterium]|nr:ABC transporter permease [Lachnospiraceae bacterium]